MSEKNKELLKKLNEMMAEEREVMDEDCKLLAERDFAKLAAEYFDLSELPIITLQSEKDGFSVNISFKAKRINNIYRIK